MRLWPLLCLALTVAAAASGPAQADGEIQVRGAYYKEKATRVVQPMTDVRLDVGADTEITAHFLVDSITSASVASGAGDDAFTENRLEGGGSLTHRRATYDLGLFFRYSDEPDYKSLFGGIRSTAELGQKNTTIGWTLALGRDRITNAGAQDPDGMAQFEPVEGDVTTVLGSLSLGQVLTPTVMVAATYDLIFSEGFLENPYRFVAVAGESMAEEVPESRVRHALFGSVRAFVPQTETTLIAGYRLYLDDWDLLGHTPDVRIVQQIVPDFDIHARYRYHRQNSASFFREVYDQPDRFITDDIKLSAFTSHTVAVRLESALSVVGFTGRMAGVRADLLLQYIAQNNRFGDAYVAQFGLEIPFEY